VSVHLHSPGELIQCKSTGLIQQPEVRGGQGELLTLTHRVHWLAKLDAILSKADLAHMVRKRISGTDRKALILNAARIVFSQAGFEAAKTQDIARAAKVSEALVYRHFPSKLSLYRAVLRQSIREQDENYRIMALASHDTAGIIKMLKTYFTLMTEPEHADIQGRFRLLLSSLSADGTYAALIYRRAQRMTEHTIKETLRNAQAAGDLKPTQIESGNASMFVEHIGTMMSALCWRRSQAAPYSSEGPELVRQAVWFCCRGIGFTDEAIARHLDD
jgi:AcrR family transcriptional regulator